MKTIKLKSTTSGLISLQHPDAPLGWHGNALTFAVTGAPDARSARSMATQTMIGFPCEDYPKFLDCLTIPFEALGLCRAVLPGGQEYRDWLNTEVAKCGKI